MGLIARRLRQKMGDFRSQKVVSLDALRLAKEEAAELASSRPNLGNLDPVLAIYADAVNFVGELAGNLLELPEMRPFRQICDRVLDEFVPEECYGPPMTPITSSFFNGWLFFDLQAGRDKETIGGIVLELAPALGLNRDLVQVLRHLATSRMGMYEYLDRDKDQVILRELVTDKVFSCHTPLMFKAEPHGLWYVRLLPPPTAQVDYHVIFTTPYVFDASERDRWLPCLNRLIAKTKIADQNVALAKVFKFGFSPKYWMEFVFEAYRDHETDACYLTGLPDVPLSRPHSRQSEALLENFSDSAPVVINMKEPKNKRYDAWRRIEHHVVAKLCAYAKDKYGFKDSTHAAWREWRGYTTQALGEGDPENQIYGPWYLYHSKRKTLTSGSAETPSESYLLDAGALLTAEERRWLQTAGEAPLTFFAVGTVKEGEGYRLRNILSQQEYEITERSGSKIMREGDVIFGAVATFDDLSLMVGISPHIFAPSDLVRVVELRRSLVKKTGCPLTMKDIADSSSAVISLYKEMRNDLTNPKPPKLVNTDDEPLKPQKMIFDLKTSVENALAALGDLVIGWSREDFNDTAKFSKNGKMTEVVFPWLRSGNARFDNWEYTVIANLKINTGTLTVDVNSDKRADGARTEIERRLGADVSFKSRVIERLDIPARKDLPKVLAIDTQQTRSGKNAQATLRNTAREHWQEWLITPLPTLDERSPIQAMSDEEGRELVIALLHDATRHKDPQHVLVKDIPWVQKQLGLILGNPKKWIPIQQPADSEMKKRQLLRGKPCSAVFQDFAEPLIQEWDAARPRPSVEVLNNMCILPWMIWNAVVLDESEHKEGDIQFLQELREKMAITPEAQVFLENMVARKRHMFSDYRYQFGQVEFYETADGDLRCRAEARLPIADAPQVMAAMSPGLLKKFMEASTFAPQG